MKRRGGIKSTGLSLLFLFLLSVGCTGPRGPEGPTGADGVSGANGAAGAPCTVSDNGDGTRTITCGDGTSATVNNGADGAAGGSCTVVDNGNGTKTITCEDGTSVTVSDGAPGAPGVSSASVVVRVVDKNSGAILPGALVTAEPSGESAVADASGRAVFQDLPIGFYLFTAEAASLQLIGDAFVAGEHVNAVADSSSLIAGDTVELEIALPRIDTASLNLITIHSTTSPLFTNANCEACHGNREGERSANPALKPFHALSMHSSLDCTFCHLSVDMAECSGFSIRKQVTVSLCAGCHQNYPTSLP